MKKTIKNICCIGAGYVGGPTMSVIADKCPEIQVNVVDRDEERIDLWNSKDLSFLPIFEPGLEDLIKRRRGLNLNFSIDIEENIRCADMIFISVNTPTKTKGVGAGEASDLRWVETCARQVAKYATGHTIVVEKSTLPVKTAEVIKAILEESSKINNQIKSTFDVLSNPEFLAEGSAIKDLLLPDRVLIGGENSFAMCSLGEIYKNWVPKEKIIYTNIWSSELAKLTANAFLAQRISSINSIGALCEATGADVREVARAVGTDSRIGSKFLDSGPGFGGSCFKKDILNLVYLSKYFGLPEVAKFWEEVVKINDWHQNRISRLIVKKLFGTVSNKKICILGFAFKANTNDTRESAAIRICKNLLEEGAVLNIHDPKVNPKKISDSLGIDQFESEKTLYRKNEAIKKWQFSNDPYQCIKGSDAVVILTEWEEYTLIDWTKCSQIMRHPAWVFDSRSILDADVFKNTEINFWRIGNGSDN